MAKLQIFCGFDRISDQNRLFASEQIYVQPQLHLQNHSHDSVGLGGEDCGGGEVNVFHPLLRQNQKVTIFAALNTLMDSEQKRISYFVSFCVEQYKNAKHLTGNQAFEELNQYGVLDYLAENYEILHTQSYQWILEDIDEFINIRKQKAS